MGTIDPCTWWITSRFSEYQSMMENIIVFAGGVLVSIVTFIAALLVGVGEAGDVNHSRWADLTDWERSIVRDKRASGDQQRLNH
jgi:hypothetical protein